MEALPVMGFFETFSKRMKRLSNEGQADIYQYSDLPQAFRVQVIHIWRDAIAADHYLVREKQDWRVIHDMLARELGMFSLRPISDPPQVKCEDFLLTAKTNEALDIIELTFRWIDRIIRERYQCAEIATQAIEELNHRFLEHGIGYQFSGGELIRVDSQYVHAEVIKPAISLLQDAGFKGAEEEFLKAHEHYRHGNTKEAIAEALKAFESTIMAICDARKWSYPAGATSKSLINILFDKGLVPSEMQSHFQALRSTLEAGLPTVRNRTSGHGQGAAPQAVPDYIASYALHLAATNILMLVQAHKALL